MSKKVLSRKQELESLRKEISKIRPVERKQITEADINNMSVQQLRRIVVDNNLFTGISRMRKKDLIEKILKSDWFKVNSLPVPKKKRPVLMDIINKDREERKLLLDDLKKLKEENLKLKIEKKGKPPPIPKTQKIKEIKISDEQKIEDGGENDDNFIQPLYSIPEAPPLILEKKEEEMDEKDKSLLTHTDKEKKQLDLGHTIINIYCGGSNHPDFPIPQSIVRQAIDSNKLPTNLQKNMANDLQTFSKKIEKFKGIPSDVIPKPVPHKTHSNIKRFQVEKPIKRVEIKDDNDKKDAFDEDEDDVIEETAIERDKRLRMEELEKVKGRGEKQRKKKDIVKAKLEGIFKERLKNPSE